MQLRNVVGAAPSGAAAATTTVRGGGGGGGGGGAVASPLAVAAEVEFYRQLLSDLEVRTSTKLLRSNNQPNTL